MDLYYAMTNYQLLDCILHKITLNKENNATVLLSSFLVYHNPNLLNDMKKSGIFSNVDVYEETTFSYEDNINIQDEIKSVCDAVERGYGDLIDGCNDIYLGQDHNSLGVFLVSKKRKFYYFEDASGTYSNPEILLSIIKGENKNRYDIIEELRLGGRSKYVKKVYCDFEHQRKDFDTTLCVDFSVKKILKKLDEDNLNRILRIYHCHKYNLKDKKKDLLLTWHYHNMRLMSLDEQREFFALLVDYFKGEKDMLFIKPHPSDRQPNYREWFKGAVVFERYMPSELLPFCIDDKFDKGITNWSTSIYGLSDVLKDIVNFDKGIDNTYRDFHKYYAVVEYLNCVKDKAHIQKLILDDDINKRQMLQLMRRYIKNYEKYYEFANGGSGIYIVKEYMANLDSKKCIAITERANSAPQSVIKVTAGDRKERVYLYNLPSVSLSVEKEMKYSGYKLLISSCDVGEYINEANNLIDEKDKIISELDEKYRIDIGVLKDKIENYERRLANYQEEVKQLRNSTSWRVTKPLRRIGGLRRRNGKREN